MPPRCCCSGPPVGCSSCWFTTRRREVGVGYGWLLRGTYLLMAAGAVVAGFAFGTVPLREAASVAVRRWRALVALIVSVVRRKAGVAGEDAEHDRRRERVAAMTGIERTVAERTRQRGPEFPPALDLVAPALSRDRARRCRYRRRRQHGRLAAAHLRRCRVPRRRHRRDAARPLVPRAAGPAPPPPQRSRACAGVGVAASR